jgi:hypothetical protein
MKERHIQLEEFKSQTRRTHVQALLSTSCVVSASQDFPAPVLSSTRWNNYFGHTYPQGFLREVHETINVKLLFQL